MLSSLTICFIFRSFSFALWDTHCFHFLKWHVLCKQSAAISIIVIQLKCILLGIFYAASIELGAVYGILKYQQSAVFTMHKIL